MEAAKRYASKSRSENTWRGYRSAWECFDTWCQEAHLNALPATPQTVAMFIAAEADKGWANATLEHRLAAIRVVHLGAGHASPHNTLAVLEVLQGIRRARRDRPGFVDNRRNRRSTPSCRPWSRPWEPSQCGMGFTAISCKKCR